MFAEFVRVTASRVKGSSGRGLRSPEGFETPVLQDAKALLDQLT
jgi:hypothetical protein